MSNSRFREILKSWIESAAEKEEMTSVTLEVRQSDFHKLQALAEVYEQPLASITGELLHAAISEIEAAMPYVAGEKVIRVEDGMNVYEDVGPTPRYLQLLKEKAGA